MSDDTTTQQKNTSPSPSQEQAMADHARYVTQLALLLLVILCLAALASFSLAPYFLTPHLYISNAGAGLLIYQLWLT